MQMNIGTELVAFGATAAGAVLSLGATALSLGSTALSLGARGLAYGADGLGWSSRQAYAVAERTRPQGEAAA